MRKTLTSGQGSPLARELHSICVILTEKVREKEAPAVTTVSTTGLLLESPMSTYTRARG